MKIITATQLKRNMKVIFDDYFSTKDPVVIKRPHGQDMVLISLAELELIKENAYFMDNKAKRLLLESMRQIKAGEVVFKTIDELHDLDDADRV